MGEHIEIPAEAGAALHPRQPGLAHPLRQLQGRGEQVQGGAQPPQAHPQLVERLRIAALKHGGLELAEPAGLALDQLQGIGAVGQAFKALPIGGFGSLRADSLGGGRREGRGVHGRPAEQRQNGKRRRGLNPSCWARRP